MPTPLAALFVVACTWGGAPDETPQCDPPFEVPVTLTLNACRDHGKEIAERFMRGVPYFEFMEVREIACEVIGHAPAALPEPRT